MARSKLSDTEKQELVRLYRETSKTAPKLAEDYGISVSTVVRILKGDILDAEYAALSQTKRGREAVTQTALAAVGNSATTAQIQEVQGEMLLAGLGELLSAPPVIEAPAALLAEVVIAEVPAAVVPSLELADPDDFLALEELPIFPDFKPAPPVPASPKPPLAILPYMQMALPNTCYIVVDRWAELIARPMREFAFLDNIPGEEQDAITLPIFDSHRWAKRFSNRFQRILRVPTKLLSLTRPYLLQRGITRFLVGRQVFNLEGDGELIAIAAGTMVLDPPLLDDEEMDSLQDFDNDDDDKAFTDDADEGEDDYGDGNGF